MGYEESKISWLLQKHLPAGVESLLLHEEKDTEVCDHFRLSDVWALSTGQGKSQSYLSSTGTDIITSICCMRFMWHSWLNI